MPKDEVYFGAAPSCARQRPQRPAQQGHEVTEPVKAATRSRLRGEEGDAQFYFFHSLMVQNNLR